MAKIGSEPKRLWLPVGSGTLASTFRGFLSGRTELCCVDVRVLSAGNARVARIAHDPGIQYFQTPEKFHERADRPPDLPSNIHYDAKIWRFIEAYGREGDLWVMDNLNTYNEKSMIKHFGERTGKKLWAKLTPHYTPKHGSWLNQAEIEISMFSRQCLGKVRVADLASMKTRARAWNRRMNETR